MSSWPDASDLMSFLIANSVMSYPLDERQMHHSLSLYLSAARREFEILTGWEPFLKDTDVVTRWYDPPGIHGFGDYRNRGRILYLGAGALSDVSVWVNVGIDSPGILLEEGTDYFLRAVSGSYNSSVSDVPWDTIEFFNIQHGFPRSIRVDAKWGRVSSIPDDVRLAILSRSAQMLAPSASVLIQGGAVQRREGDVEWRYASSGVLGEVIKTFELDYMSTVERYKRIVC